MHPISIDKSAKNMVKSSKKVIAMINIKEHDFSLISIEKFDFKIVYVETHSEGKEEFELHSHDEIEFYIGVEGDVSFLVNNNIYPVSYGDIVISRPGEQHHCICRSEKDRKYFCIWFSYEKNPFLTALFQENITETLISPDKEKKEQLMKTCYELLQSDISDEEKYFNFFNILGILKSARGNFLNPVNIPEDLKIVLEYIDAHIYENMRISNMAEELYISESTIERRFKEWLGIKPGEFIRKKKMIKAAQTLLNGGSVLDAGLASGYSDNSHFIKLFKQHYGVTPHKYKKENKEPEA